MTLGENIRRLRTKRNLSQEDLAEQLEVSRQSVSKWETDASTPDLDKLVKLSRVFGVTLDELVCGAQLKPESPTYIPQLEKTRTPLRVVVGIVLLCMAFLTFWGGALLDGHLGSGLLLAAPFVLCGVICLLVPWHPGLVCAWTMSAVLDFFAVAELDEASVNLSDLCELLHDLEGLLNYRNMAAVHGHGGYLADLFCSACE